MSEEHTAALTLATDLIKCTMDFMRSTQQHMLSQQVAMNSLLMPMLLTQSMPNRCNLPLPIATTLNPSQTLFETDMIPEKRAKFDVEKSGDCPKTILVAENQKTVDDVDEHNLDVGDISDTLSTRSHFMSEVSLDAVSNVSYSAEGSGDEEEEQVQKLKKCTKCYRRFKSDRIMENHMKTAHRRVRKRASEDYF